MKKKFLTAIVLAAVLSVFLITPAFAITEKEVGDCSGYTWENDGDVWYCYDEDGMAVTGFAVKDGDFYYFDRRGNMKTGWIKYKKDGSWYYFYKEDDDIDSEDIGKMAVSTWIDNYRVDEEGKMDKKR